MTTNISYITLEFSSTPTGITQNFPRGIDINLWTYLFLFNTCGKDKKILQRFLLFIFRNVLYNFCILIYMYTNLLYINLHNTCTCMNMVIHITCIRSNIKSDDVPIQTILTTRFILAMN